MMKKKNFISRGLQSSKYGSIELCHWKFVDLQNALQNYLFLIIANL